MDILAQFFACFSQKLAQARKNSTNWSARLARFCNSESVIPRPSRDKWQYILRRNWKCFNCWNSFQMKAPHHILLWNKITKENWKVETAIKVQIENATGWLLIVDIWNKLHKNTHSLYFYEKYRLIINDDLEFSLQLWKPLIFAFSHWRPEIINPLRSSKCTILPIFYSIIQKYLSELQKYQI